LSKFIGETISLFTDVQKQTNLFGKNTLFFNTKFKDHHEFVSFSGVIILSS